MNLENLFSDCFRSLKEDIEEEVNYRNSDESISEDLENNNYEFTEDGKIYNS